MTEKEYEPKQFPAPKNAGIAQRQSEEQSVPFYDSESVLKMVTGENKIIDGGISGIWEVPYVCEMGIEKHCRLILNLIDEVERNKIRHSSQYAEDTLKNEMADLFIILEKYFSLENGHLINQRKQLFNKHQIEDEKYFKR